MRWWGHHKQLCWRDLAKKPKKRAGKKEATKGVTHEVGTWDGGIEFEKVGKTSARDF